MVNMFSERTWNKFWGPDGAAGAGGACAATGGAAAGVVTGRFGGEFGVARWGAGGLSGPAK